MDRGASGKAGVGVVGRRGAVGGGLLGRGLVTAGAVVSVKGSNSRGNWKASC